MIQIQVMLTSHEDLPLICGWTGQADKTEDSLKIVYDDMIRVRRENPFVFKEPEAFKMWFNELEKKAWDYEKLRKNCEEEVVSLKADKLPERKLIY